MTRDLDAALAETDRLRALTDKERGLPRSNYTIDMTKEMSRLPHSVVSTILNHPAINAHPRNQR